jgi:putative RecB family exonuclease
MIAGVGEALLPVLTPTKPANPANEVAKKLTGRDYVSWSALSTFRTCPLKYRFRYVDGLPEESVSSALVFGTGIHTAVEQHYQAILSGDPKPDLDALMFAYRSAWLPHDPDAIQFGSTETRASLDALASRMLTAFLNSPAASVRGRVLGVEEELRGVLMKGVPDLYGRVDLLTEDSDSLVITDIKTSRGKWSQEQVEDSGEQLLLYSHLASEISPGKKVQTRFLVLTKTREPVVEEHVREVNPVAVKRTLASVERVWRAIESGVFYPAPSTMNCASCGYRAACRAWMGEHVVHLTRPTIMSTSRGSLRHRPPQQTG